VADNTGAAPARRHRAGIGIRQRYLLIRSGEHLHPENLEAMHLLLQLRDLLFQVARLGFKCLGRLLPVGGVELLQIARDTLLNLRHAPVHLGAREVLVAIVDALNLLPSMATLACVTNPSCGTAQRSVRTLCGWRCHCPCGNRQSSCDLEPNVPSPTSPRRCAQPRAQAGDSTGSD